MEILMVSLELSPYVRQTDAAESVASLSKALRQLGHNVTVALPRQPGFEDSGLFLARRLTPLRLPDGGEVPLIDAQLPSGVQVTLFDAPVLFDRPGAYGETEDYPDNAARFALLSQAAASLVRQRAEQGTQFDIVHLHDAPTALVPLLLSRMPGPSVPTVLTIHDATRQGSFELDAAEGLPRDLWTDPSLVVEGEVNLLRAGLAHAQVVTTVSPGYSSELARGFGAFSKALEASGKQVIGITNGVDYSVVNPATDAALASRYDAENPSGKAICKGAVLRELELSVELERPLILIEGPLTPERGGELLLASLPLLLKRDAFVVVASELSAPQAKKLRLLRSRRRDDFGLVERPTAATARRAYAAADIALFAPRHCPCGQSQLVAERYGAIPVARAVGGMCDTIVDADAALETGTGFLFDEESEAALDAAVGRALAALSSASAGRFRRRIMRLDSSWDRPARRYLQVYRSALGAGR